MDETTEKTRAAVEPGTRLYQAAKAVLALSLVERRALEIVVTADSGGYGEGQHAAAYDMWVLADALLTSLVAHGDMRDPGLGKRTSEEGGGV
jgi:hypothetical protein